MITYLKEEIVPSSVVARNFSSLLNQLQSQKLEKIAVMRNNKMEAVILNITYFEALKQLAEIFENLEIDKIVRERMKDNLEDAVSFDSVLEKYGIKKRQI